MKKNIFIQQAVVNCPNGINFEADFTEDLSIVIAPNGYGKTFLLREINRILSEGSNTKYTVLKTSIPINEIQVFDYKPGYELGEDFGLNWEHINAFENKVRKALKWLRNATLRHEIVNVDLNDFLINPFLYSDGERNLVNFISFCCCVAEEKKPTVILIDNPELFLHIEVQEELLSCLLDCIGLDQKQYQIIMATQSPDLIGIYEPCIVTLNKNQEEEQ